MISYALPKKETWPTSMALPNSDTELLGRIAAGEEAALQELYTLYGQRLYAYALRLTDDPAVAEDAVQLTLMTVWRTAGRYRGEGRVLAWLLGILHHTALKSVRRRTLPISEGMEETLISASPLPEEQALAGEQAWQLRQGLKGLSPEHRAVLELIFYQELTITEAAKVCGCPPGTIKSRLNYARRHLRGHLNRQNFGEVWK
ncbi:MAG: RNA polymerase sigma factor [Anaerolineaceae bacterium]